MCELCRQRETEGKNLTVLAKKHVLGRQVTLWRSEYSIYTTYRVTVSIPNPNPNSHYTYSKDGGSHRKIHPEDRKEWRSKIEYDNVNRKTMKKVFEMFDLWDNYQRTRKEVNAILDGRENKAVCPKCGHKL